jgi:hypothetical protein
MPPNPYRRQPNINDMMYPKGSKQPRQVWAAVMNVYKAPETSPVPTTPTPTPSITASPTVTPTQTQTGTPNITSSPTQTPSGTPQITPTPSVSPTQTGTPQVTSSPTSTPTPTSTVLPGTVQANTYLSAVVAAGGTVDSTMSAATRTLFQSIWSNGLNAGMVMMYPFIGGTAASHAIQAMSPGTYNLTFNGGWTQNLSGSTPNGTNAYAVINIAPVSLPFKLSGSSIGVYCGTDGGGTAVAAIGCTGTNNGALNLYPAINNPTKQMATTYWNSGFALYSITTIPDTLGLMSLARSGSTSTVQFYRRGSLVSSQTQNAVALPNVGIYLAANNQFGSNTNQYSTYRHQFTYLYTETMSESQMATLDGIIQTYQTSLGRNVY